MANLQMPKMPQMQKTPEGSANRGSSENGPEGTQALRPKSKGYCFKQLTRSPTRATE